MNKSEFKEWLCNNTIIKDAILEYQCFGCLHGSNIDCGECVKSNIGVGCQSHTPATLDSMMRNFYLGMPKGFNKIGPQNEYYLNIFENDTQQRQHFPYNWLNVPVWKYKNNKGHIFVKGLSPRINMPFLHIILEGNIDNIDNCIEITENELKEID